MLRRALVGGVESGESLSEDAASSTPNESAQRLEHYELVTDKDGQPIELGRGAMGVTYKAFDVDLRCPVTLKVISEKYLGDEAARLRFLREARAAASVRHPNVASVFHLGRTGENYFYAMEFVEGETLETLIKRSGRLEVKLALEIAAQVAGGLAAVHKKGLVHRDIKPSNIMVRRTLGDCERRLDNSTFFRANRGCIVNLSHVKQPRLLEDERLSFLLNDGKEVVFSRRQSVRFRATRGL